MYEPPSLVARLARRGDRRVVELSWTGLGRGPCLLERRTLGGPLVKWVAEKPQLNLPPDEQGWKPLARVRGSHAVDDSAAPEQVHQWRVKDASDTTATAALHMVHQAWLSAEEVNNQLRDYSARYPAMIRLKSLARTAHGREVLALRLSGPNTPNHAPCVLLNGVHHGNETGGCRIVLHCLQQLLDHYGKDANLTKLMDHVAVWFVPLVNPDGYAIAQAGLPTSWRKNARDVDMDAVLRDPTQAPTAVGVDLNRNYDNPSWRDRRKLMDLPALDLDGLDDPHFRWYRGQKPWSEPETRGMRDLVLGEPIVFSVSYHGTGGIVHISARWQYDEQRYRMLNDAPLQTSIAGTVAALTMPPWAYIPRVFPLAANAAGYSHSWMHIGAGIHDFVMEEYLYPHPLRTFWLPLEEIDAACARNLAALRFLMARTRFNVIYCRVLDDATGKPLDVRVSIQELADPHVTPRRTHGSGWVHIPVDFGLWTVVVNKPGYRTSRRRVEVRCDGPLGISELEVRLKRSRVAAQAQEV